MSPALMYAANAVAILLLVFGIFLPRHGRRELVVAYLGVNVGVLAVASALATSSINAGLGLGLFGVLSIIRLRSEELSQHEVAYYFAALALGLIGGLSIASTPWHLALMGLVVAALWLGDHPRIARHTTRQEVLLDHALADPEELRLAVAAVVPGELVDVAVVRTDLVNDTTLVVAKVDRTRRGLRRRAAARTAAGGPGSRRPADDLVGTATDRR